MANKITTDKVKIKITKEFKKGNKILLEKGAEYEVSPSDAEHFVNVKKIAEKIK